MNLLTKLFIVLLVVCSLLMTAAMVVFVSRTEDNVAARKAAENQRTEAEEKAKALTAESSQLRNQMANNTALAAKENAALAAKVDDAMKQATAADQKAQAAEANAQRAAAALETALANVKSAQTAAGQKDVEIGELRKTSDTLQRQIGDLNVALTTKLKELDWALKQLKLSEERLADAQQQLEKAKAQLTATGHPFNPDLNVPRPVRLNGVVESVVDVAGGKAAEISIGEDAGVAKTMKFIISDADGNFLAELTIVDVQPDKSTGLLQGPRMSEVKKGMKVTTPNI